MAPVGVLHVGALVDARTPASLLQELEVDDGGLGFRGWQDVRLGEPDRGDWLVVLCSEELLADFGEDARL